MAGHALHKLKSKFESFWNSKSVVHSIELFWGPLIWAENQQMASGSLTHKRSDEILNKFH